MTVRRNTHSVFYTYFITARLSILHDFSSKKAIHCLMMLLTSLRLNYSRYESRADIYFYLYILSLIYYSFIKFANQF